jgi:serine/threonine-protein kinase
MTTEMQDPFVKGQRIDRYEIREHIGQGGMGAVYRAVDTKLGRVVALKTVVAHRRGDRLTEEIRERFMREALAASRVDHRNVVQVLDFGFADDGTPYMVMEYLRGRSLSELIKKTTEPLAIDYVADVMMSVCAALRACHHVGIIHRDLKPANIFLCDTDTGWEVKVLDFGISKAPATEDLTEDGQIIGTPQYLSPEQIEGNVGPESDQYALGVLMYMCLTRRLPYADYQSMRLFRAIAEGKFDPPRKLRPDIPDGLDAIVLRAMHLSPKARFESIHALGQRLWEFASSRGQAQWKTFYFHTPAAAQPVKVDTSANEARLRELGREKLGSAPTGPAPAPEPSKDEKPRVDSTASLEPVSALARTEPLRPTAVAPESLPVTKTAAASGVGEATSLSQQSDIAGESALSDAQDPFSRTRARRLARQRVALAIAALAVVTFVVQRAWRSNHPAAPAAASVVVAAPATAAPSPAPAPAPAAAAVPAPARPAKPPPAPAAEAAAPAVATRAATAPPAAKEEPTPKEAPPPKATRRKHATHRSHAPKMDQHGIGIPTE